MSSICNMGMERHHALDWKLLLTEDQIQFYVKKCAAIINEKFAGKKIVVVCVLKGAVYFFVDLTRYLTIEHSCYFIESSSYHNNQTQSETCSIMGSIEPSKFVDRDVILIDELFDNGLTLHQVKTAINEKALVDLDRIFTCTLFKKNKSTKYPEPDLFGVCIPNVWVVGYGLDDNQEKRNWTCLFACPKSEGIPESDDDIIFKDCEQYVAILQQFCNDQ